MTSPVVATIRDEKPAGSRTPLASGGQERAVGAVGAAGDGDGRARVAAIAAMRAEEEGAPVHRPNESSNRKSVRSPSASVSPLSRIATRSIERSVRPTFAHASGGAVYAGATGIEVGLGVEVEDLADVAGARRALAQRLGRRTATR